MVRTTKHADCSSADHGGGKRRVVTIISLSHLRLKNHSEAGTVPQYYTSRASILAKPLRGGGGVGIHFGWNLDRSPSHVVVVRLSTTALGLPLGLAFHTSRGHWLKTRRRKHDSVTAITEGMTV